MKNYYSFLIFFLVSLGAAMLIIGGSILVQADTLYVDDSGGADFISIQDAIDMANESDTVYVYSGTYNENIAIDKTITLSGTGSSSTKIIGSDSNKNTVVISADLVVLSGFLIDNTAGRANQYHGVYLNGVTSCIISENNIENSENGLYLLNAGDITIDGNTISDNNQKGIRLSNSHDNNIQSNTIRSNGDGIYLTSSNDNNIFENDILQNVRGISLSSCSGNVMYKNDFDDNGENAYDANSNIWSKNNQGNYWDDYNNYDSNPKDGIGDVFYEIDRDSLDMYPLGDFIDEKPVAYIDSIDPNPTTEGELISFSGHGLDDGLIAGWEWRSSKDGLLNSGSAAFSTTSLSVGDHIIQFRVKDNENQWSEYSEQNLTIIAESVSENQLPIARIVSISPSETLYGQSVSFSGDGTDADGYIVGYNWQSSIDGVLNTKSSFSTDKLSFGSHIISFKVKDYQGDWSAPVTSTVNIIRDDQGNLDPIADAGGSYTGKINVPVVFDASGSYDPDNDSIVSYTWEFGDGKKGTGIIITHSYNITGNFTVNLTVTDMGGAFSSDSTFALILLESEDTNGGGDGDGSSSTTDTPGFLMYLMFFTLILMIPIYKYRLR